MINKTVIYELISLLRKRAANKVVEIDDRLLFLGVANLLEELMREKLGEAPYCSYCEAYHTTETPCLSRR